MAKIWYSTLKTEHKISNTLTLKAGTVFNVKKLPADLVSCTELHGTQTCYIFPRVLCQLLMTQPSVDLDAVMEESFMVCEANYC